MLRHHRDVDEHNDIDAASVTDNYTPCYRNKGKHSDTDDLYGEGGICDNWVGRTLLVRLCLRNCGES